MTDVFLNVRRLDTPAVNLDQLIPHVEELLVREAKRAEAEQMVIHGITLILHMEDGELATDVIRPATPTLAVPLLRRLILLRLSARQFSSGVERIAIYSEKVQPSRSQKELFATRGRDLMAGAQVFAEVRARFGNESVTYACLGDSYLPEKSFRLISQKQPVLPARQRAATKQPMAVRRILLKPKQVPCDSQEKTEISEPFIVSGSWWGKEGAEAPFLRHYSFHNSPGGILWAFVDKYTDTAWVQGVVD
jgi:hypothetical protein